MEVCSYNFYLNTVDTNIAMICCFPHGCTVWTWIVLVADFNFNSNLLWSELLFVSSAKKIDIAGESTSYKKIQAKTENWTNADAPKLDYKGLNL